MDEIERHWMEHRQKKYRDLYKHPNYARSGGIFGTRKRKQLLGLYGKAGRDRTNANFWYDVRETVKTALIDLQLFIETTEEKDVTKVLTRETLEPILQVLFAKRQKQDDPKLIGRKAKVAQLFAESGLEYLWHNSKHLRDKEQQEIIDTIELSKQMTVFLLPDSEKDSFFWIGSQRL